MRTKGMKALDIARHRLFNQQISRPPFEKPGDLVCWFGAVQAQDYLPALWAVGLRTRRAVEATVEQAIAQRSIIRTWPMRGTLHFVAPNDAHWMLQLLTPRVVASSARRYRELELDDAVFARAEKKVIAALQGGNRLTRRALYDALAAAGISTASSRGLHIVGYLAQRRVICFGPRAGKQPTLVLLDEWVPNAKRLERPEALTELTTRYFTSHGPATVHDFAWWSGLTIADVRAGLEGATSRLLSEVIDGRTYWFAATKQAAAQLERAKAMEPSFLHAHSWLANAYMGLGRYDDAVRIAEEAYALSNSALPFRGLLAGIYGQVGRTDEARTIIRDVVRSPDAPPFFMALLHLVIDEYEQVYEWLDRGVRERGDLMHSLRTNPFFIKVWRDPRFAAVLERMRLGPPLEAPA